MNIITDKNEWDNILEKEFNKYDDVYFRSEYFEIYTKYYNCKREAIFWEDKNIKIFWPHLIRDISKIKQFKNFKYYDLTTPYGYGGPLINVKIENIKDTNNSLEKFSKEYKDYAFDNKYICEFIRFHPIFQNWKFFENFCNINNLNDVVIIYLNQDLDKIFNNIKKGHKYNIKKSEKEGCKVDVINNPTRKNIDDFIKIYYQTMDKNKASKEYYFSKNFIKDYFNNLGAILIEARYKNKVIGSSMFIYRNKIIHYYLSGASNEFKGLYPSNLMVWEGIKWAQENGFEILNLGGGRAKNDSLFEFKRGFSNIIQSFKIGKIIFNNNIYEALSKLNNKLDNEYFPKYRQGLNKTII